MIRQIDIGWIFDILPFSLALLPERLNGLSRSISVNIEVKFSFEIQ